MKTGRPGYYIPSPLTASRDTKAVFGRVCTKITKILREYEGKVSFATDAWTSPNHHAFMAVTAHLEHNGDPLCFLLDIVEVAKVLTSAVLCVEVLIPSVDLCSRTPASIWPLPSFKFYRSLELRARLVANGDMPMS